MDNPRFKQVRRKREIGRTWTGEDEAEKQREGQLNAHTENVRERNSERWGEGGNNFRRQRSDKRLACGFIISTMLYPFRSA